MVNVALRNLCIDFPLLQAEQRSFKRLLSRPFKSSRFGVDHRERLVLHALRNINLVLAQGDRVALSEQTVRVSPLSCGYLQGSIPPYLAPRVSRGASERSLRPVSECVMT